MASRCRAGGVSKIGASSSRFSGNAITSLPDEHDSFQWVLGDAALGFALAYVLTLVFTPLMYKLTGQSLDTPSDQVPLSTLAMQQVPFYGGMVSVPLMAARYKGRGPIVDLGLRMRWS